MYLDTWEDYHVLSVTGGRTGQTRKYKELQNVEVVKEVSWYEGNKWKRDNEFTVFKFDGGFGVATETPSGWSSWTYDPSNTYDVMYTDDFEQFLKMALDDEQRSKLERE